jgi:thiopurine S-methyltransferase
VGDFLALPAAVIADVQGWYDRAALIALPPAMRARYVDHLLAHLAAGTPGLLITFAYDQQLMEGPPFAVHEAEVRRLMADRADIDLLEMRRNVPFSEHLRDKGLADAHDDVYRLRIRTRKE